MLLLCDIAAVCLLVVGNRYISLRGGHESVLCIQGEEVRCPLSDCRGNTHPGRARDKQKKKSPLALWPTRLKTSFNLALAPAQKSFAPYPLAVNSCLYRRASSSSSGFTITNAPMILSSDQRRFRLVDWAGGGGENETRTLAFRARHFLPRPHCCCDAIFF